MSENALIAAYEKARATRKEAEEWVNLQNEIGHIDHRRFAMSPVHAHITLMICGQHSPGSKNYWESPECLRVPLAEVIKSDPSILERAIDILREKEREASKAAEETLRKTLAAISEELK